MNKFDILAISVFAAVIILNIITTRYLMRKAVRKFVIPKLETKDLVYLRHKWAGFFTTGDFKEPLALSFFNVPGRLSIYVYVFYRDKDVEGRLTIEIDTFMLFIRKVVFSDRSIDSSTGQN